METDGKAGEAQWDGIDAMGVREFRLINSPPWRGAALHHCPSPILGTCSPCSNRQRLLEDTDYSGWGETQRFHLRYQQAVKTKDQSEQHRGSVSHEVGLRGRWGPKNSIWGHQGARIECHLAPGFSSLRLGSSGVESALATDVFLGIFWDLSRKVVAFLALC